jgi:CBS domain-containing protein
MTTIAGEVMTPNPAWVGETDDLQQVASRMWDLHVSSRPVCDVNGKLRGLITYRDINLRSLTDGGDPATATASGLTRGACATIGVADPFDSTWWRGSGHEAGLLPVLDGQHLVGVISRPRVTASVTAPPRTRPAALSDALQTRPTPTLRTWSPSPAGPNGSVPGSVPGSGRRRRSSDEDHTCGPGGRLSTPVTSSAPQSSGFPANWRSLDEYHR